MMREVKRVVRSAAKSAAVGAALGALRGAVEATNTGFEGRSRSRSSSASRRRQTRTGRQAGEENEARFMENEEGSESDERAADRRRS